MLIAGILLQTLNLVVVAIALFAAVVLFQLVTLPVEFDGVGFTYPSADLRRPLAPALNDVSLRIDPGELVAIAREKGLAVDDKLAAESMKQALTAHVPNRELALQRGRGAVMAIIVRL